VNTPGLKVVVASGADSAYGLLRAAIRDDDPVVVLEPRILYGEREDVDVDAYRDYQIGKARTVVQGDDVTVVALGQTVPIVRAVAAASSVGVEVIDLCSIAPWDIETVAASVGRTKRLVTVEANPYSGGWGADIVAEIQRRHHGELEAPAVRVTCPDVLIPYAANLERQYIPTEDIIRSQIEHLVRESTAPAHWWEEGAHA
jgi:pyruvate dehydrogenase E1 component beta subunit